MKNKSFIDSISVKNPCNEDWNEMSGNERVRFCSHCSKDINNLSEMTRKEAMKLVIKNRGRLCVGYYQKPDGSLHFLKQRLHKITRQTGLAAGMLSAGISLNTAAFPQSPEPQQIAVNEAVQTVKVSDDLPSLSGYIRDDPGGLIPYALITLINESTNEYFSANSNHEGYYEFKELADGSYKMRVDAGGFASREMASINITAGLASNQNIVMKIEGVKETVNIGDDLDGSGSFTIGIVSCETSSFKPRPLIDAVYEENFERVKELIARGIKVNAKNGEGDTALHVAIEMGNYDIAEYLLSHRAKVNSRNKQGLTPLMKIDSDATRDLINLLLRFGAKINLLDKEKNTALHHFAEFDDPEVTQLLINSGANINALNKQKQTPLMIAAENGSLENVKSLLGAGALVNLKNKDGESAIGLTRDIEIRQYLTSYGAIE